jgi:hypothetical protein
MRHLPQSRAPRSQTMQGHETLEWDPRFRKTISTRRPCQCRRHSHMYQLECQLQTDVHLTRAQIPPHLLGLRQYRTWRPKSVLERRTLKALTPYNAEAWGRSLRQHGLLQRFGHIPLAMITGFDAGIPKITTTFSPPNSPTIITFQHSFNDIIKKEFDEGRYLGPWSLNELTELIGQFQSSPLSLVDKPGKPGKHRLVQNLSYPHPS